MKCLWFGARNIGIPLYRILVVRAIKQIRCLRGVITMRDCKCPNCGKEVILTEYFKSFYHWEDECEYYYKTSKGSCDACKISYDDGNWIIPEELQPTEKQKCTVMFIRNRLNPPLDDLGITKQSYIKFIGKYFEQAKKTPLSSPIFSDELDELYDLLPDPGFFC